VALVALKNIFTMINFFAVLSQTLCYHLSEREAWKGDDKNCNPIGIKINY